MFDGHLRRLGRPEQAKADSRALRPFPAGALPPAFTIAGVGRTPFTNESFRDHLHEALHEFNRISPDDGEAWRAFAPRLHYITADPGDTTSFPAIKKDLLAIDSDHRSSGNILFYLATPPSLYEPIIRNIDAVGLYAPRSSQSWVRIIIEKPFGIDLTSARHLNATVLSVFTEDQIYRIDHYLGKDTVQNLLVLPVCQRHLRADLEPQLRG